MTLEMGRIVIPLISLTLQRSSNQEGRIVIPLISLTLQRSSNQEGINSHLNSLNTKKTMTYDIGNPGPGCGVWRDTKML
jgi:hypothetical protein